MAFASPDLFATDRGPALAPRVKLEKGAGAAPGASGGFGADLLSAAAGAFGVAQADPLTDALVSVDLHLVAAPRLSTCKLQFLPRSDFPALAPGAAITVRLGGNDNGASNGGPPPAVFAGEVARLSGGSNGGSAGLEVLLAGPAAKLARIRRNTGYEGQGFADLLGSWAGEAGLSTGRIDRGPDYAYFAIDDRLSLWDWIARVARHADVPAWCDAQGALQAHAAAGPALATFRCGETVLALRTQARDPVTSGARIVGEGSAGRQGSDAWAWLAKDPQGVSAGGAGGAGGGLGGSVEQDGGLRSLAAVASAAAGAAAGAQRQADGVQLRVPGTAALDVGSVFAIEGAPGGDGDGRWQVVEVRHRHARRGGFVTELTGAPLA